MGSAEEHDSRYVVVYCPEVHLMAGISGTTKCLTNESCENWPYGGKLERQWAYLEESELTSFKIIPPRLCATKINGRVGYHQVPVNQLALSQGYQLTQNRRTPSKADRKSRPKLSILL